MNTIPAKKRKGSGIAFVLPPARQEAAEGAAQGVPPIEAEKTPPEARQALPRTGVGLLATTVFETAKLEERIAALQGEVTRLAAERGAQRLDPRSIVPSRWANRHEDSFADAAFEAFQREIEDAGGNVQPIKVRPLAAAAAPTRRRGKGGAADAPLPRYEIVFGHRRHRACLALGLPVLAVVQPLADTELFVHMERENRARQNLSAWEQGRMYLRALDEGLFSSNRQLAAAIGRDLSDVGKALRIAQLPAQVVDAFPSPTAIQFRWAAELARALERDAPAVLAAAQEASRTQPRPDATAVFAALTAGLRRRGDGTVPPPAAREIDLGAGRTATVRADARGRTLVELAPGVLPAQRWDALEAALKRLLAEAA